MAMYKVYAEDVETGARRYLGKALGTNTGQGLFELYQGECGDTEEVVLETIPEAVSAAASALGSIRTEKKARSSRANGLKGGRPKGSGDLTPLQREALELRQSGLKIKEIAAKMGRQPENIRQLVARAETKTGTRRED